MRLGIVTAVCLAAATTASASLVTLSGQPVRRVSADDFLIVFKMQLGDPTPFHSFDINLADRIETVSDGFRFRTHSSFTPARTPVYPALGSLSVLPTPQSTQATWTSPEHDPILTGVEDNLAGTAIPAAPSVPPASVDTGSFSVMVSAARVPVVAAPILYAPGAYLGFDSPEPGSWVMIMTGAVLIGAGMWRRRSTRT